MWWFKAEVATLALGLVVLLVCTTIYISIRLDRREWNRRDE